MMEITLDAQEIANRMGAGIRNTELALSSHDVAAANVAITVVHQAASDAYVYLRDVLGVDLDWSQITGQADETKGAHVDGGVGKDEPSKS